MMQFPVILKLSGQDELLYAADKHSLAQHYQLQSAYLLPDDIVIDSTGNAYPLQSLYANNLPQQASQQFSLAELTQLVQAHFFSLAQSCVVKIQAPSIPGLFQLLEQTEA